MPERLVPSISLLSATVQNDRVAAARILVVEDSNAIRVPVATALSAQGFELASAADEATLNDCCHPLVRSRDLG
jgi:PleD family two-component response regulator